jgi:hypothetical protein
VTKTGYSATFVYDGNRVKSTINGVTTAFIGNSFEWHTDANDKVRYYAVYPERSRRAGSQRLAMRTGNNVPTSTLTYLFGDHPSTTLRKFLGSTSLTYKADTGATTTQLYSPRGEAPRRMGMPKIRRLKTQTRGTRFLPNPLQRVSPAPAWERPGTRSA